MVVHPHRTLLAIGLLMIVLAVRAGAQDYPPAFNTMPKLPDLGDKTLVVWCSPANTTQRGSGVLSLDRQGQFDAIVLGEVAAGKWMAGSDNFQRTQTDQSAWPVETVQPGAPIQLAAVYRGREVTLLREGQPYASYTVAQPATFGTSSQVLIGLRHEALRHGTTGYFAGTVEEARLYAQALDAAQIQALRPGVASQPAPLAMWTFDEGRTDDVMGTFPPGELFGGASIADGRLVLDGVDDCMITPAGVRYDPTLHFRPATGVMGDAIPFYWDGVYHVFYLTGPRWGHLASRDLVHWQQLPDALERGTDPEGPDGEACWTGSIVAHDGRFLLFYTGKNLRDPKGDQKVMRAISDDLITWRKQPELTFYADGEIYWSKPVNGAIDDRLPYHHQAFRDPLVFRSEADGQWRLLLHAARADGSAPVFALYESSDLDHWTPCPPLFEYPAAVSGDCPDYFEAGGRWYLIAANHHYTFADAPGGPFAPEMIPYACGDLTVPKTMFDGRRRLLVGWLWDYEGLRDAGKTVWGGCMSMVRELVPDGQGRLRQRPPREVVAAFSRTVLDRPAGVAAGERLEVPRDYLLHVRLRAAAPGAQAAIVLRQPEADPAGGYRLTIDLDARTVALGSRYRSYEQVCDFDPQAPVDVRLFVVGTVIECFINDAEGFTMRAYDDWGRTLHLETPASPVQIETLRVQAMP